MLIKSFAKRKNMDMMFYSINNKIAQGQFRVFWRPGTENLADNQSTHDLPNYHRKVGSTYLYTGKYSTQKICVTTTVGVVPTKQVQQRANLKRLFPDCVNTSRNKILLVTRSEP